MPFGRTPSFGDEVGNSVAIQTHGRLLLADSFTRRKRRKCASMKSVNVVAKLCPNRLRIFTRRFREQHLAQVTRRFLGLRISALGVTAALMREQILGMH